MTRHTAVALLALVVSLAGTHHGLTASSQASRAAVPDPHAYFKALSARPDLLVAYSLRDPAQLVQPKDGGFAHSNSRKLAVTYAPADDRHPRRQDAAKVVIPSDGNNLRNQLRMPIDHRGAAFTITWDAWWDEEFAYERSGIRNYKAFQLASGGRIWTEIRSRFQAAARLPGSVALVDVRPYGGSAERRGSRVGSTKYGSGSLGGQMATFAIAPNTWTRYWVQLAPRADGGWWDFSMWMADETRDPVQLFDREAVKPQGKGWDAFWVEYNTSTSGAKPGRTDLVSYVRNVVVLAGSPNRADLLKRPSGAAPPAKHRQADLHATPPQRHAD